MGEFTDKATGKVNETIGKAKVAAGQRTDNGELIAKGIAQQAKGEAQKLGGEIKGAAGDKV